MWRVGAGIVLAGGLGAAAYYLLLGNKKPNEKATKTDEADEEVVAAAKASVKSSERCDGAGQSSRLQQERKEEENDTEWAFELEEPDRRAVEVETGPSAQAVCMITDSTSPYATLSGGSQYTSYAEVPSLSQYSDESIVCLRDELATGDDNSSSDGGSVESRDTEITVEDDAEQSGGDTELLPRQEDAGKELDLRPSWQKDRANGNGAYGQSAAGPPAAAAGRQSASDSAGGGDDESIVVIGEEAKTSF